NQLAWFDTDL
nr:Chain C, decameric peptide form Catenin beta-1 [synthetic construct]3DIW_D Chain D, decameric peptide form Catenin beta-1 [synthetic construct]